MRKKNILAFMVMSLMIFNIFISPNIEQVYAATMEDTSSNVTVVIHEKNEGEILDVTPPLLNDEVHNLGLMRTSLRPTESYNLTGRDYYYHLYGMTNYVYTEYTFNTDSSGRISISTDGLDSGGKDIKIILYEDGFWSGTEVSSWIGNPKSIQGLGFNGLNSSKKYYFKFEAYNASSVSGGGYIHHP